MTDDLFKSNGGNEDLSADPFSTPSVTIDETKDYFSELVGDDKKFKTPQDLAKGKAHSDAYIAHLLREMKEVKEELNKRLTLEEFMTNFDNRSMGNPGTLSNPGVPQPNEQPKAEALNLEDIKRQVREELEAKSREDKRNSNISEVSRRMTEAYGEQASLVIQSRAKELGVSTKHLQDLAADAPAAFFRLIGEPEQKSNIPIPSTVQNPLFSPPRSAVNTPATTQNTSGERTMAYYQKLKNADLRKYNSPEVQIQMHKDALRLGEKFFSE